MLVLKKIICMFTFFSSLSSPKKTNVTHQESQPKQLIESKEISYQEVSKAIKDLNYIKQLEESNNTARKDKVKGILTKVDQWFARWESREIIVFFNHMTTLWEPELFIGESWQAEVLMKLIRLTEQKQVSIDPSNPSNLQEKTVDGRRFKLFDENNYFSLLFKPLFIKLKIKKLYYYLLSNASEIDQSDLRRAFEKERYLFIQTLLMAIDLAKVRSSALLAFSQWDRRLFFEVFNHLPLEDKRKIWTALTLEEVTDQSPENIVMFFVEYIKFAVENSEIGGFEFLSFLQEVHPYIKNNFELRKELLRSCESKYKSGLLRPKQIGQNEVVSYFLLWHLAKTVASPQEDITKNYSFFLKLRQVEGSMFRTMLGNVVVYHQETESSLANRLLQEHTTFRGKRLQNAPGLLVDFRPKIEQKVSKKIERMASINKDRSKNLSDSETIPDYLLEPFEVESPLTVSHSSSSSSFFENSEKARIESSLGAFPAVLKGSFSSSPQLIDQAEFPTRDIARTFTLVLRNRTSSPSESVAMSIDYKSKIQSRTKIVDPMVATPILIEILVADVLAGNEWTGGKRANALQKMAGKELVAIDYQADYGALFEEYFGSKHKETKAGNNSSGVRAEFLDTINKVRNKELSGHNSQTLLTQNFDELMPRFRHTVKKLSDLLTTETVVTAELKEIFADAIRQLGSLAIIGQFDKDLATNLAGLCLRLPLKIRDELSCECTCDQEFKQIQKLKSTLHTRMNERCAQNGRSLSNSECDQLQNDVISFKSAYDSIKEKYPVLCATPFMENLQKEAIYFEEQEAKIREVDYCNMPLAYFFQK